MKEPTDKMALRRMFLNEGKTQFVFLKFIFTSQELLTEKPSVLLAQIYEHLSLEKKDFKVASFRMWLFRYRKSYKSQAPSTATSSLIDKEEQALFKDKTVPSSGEKSRPIEDDFKFTDPSTRKKEDDVIIRFVKHKK